MPLVPATKPAFKPGEKVTVRMPLPHNHKGGDVWSEVEAEVITCHTGNGTVRVRYLSGGLRGCCGGEHPSRLIRAKE